MAVYRQFIHVDGQTNGKIGWLLFGILVATAKGISCSNVTQLRGSWRKVTKWVVGVREQQILLAKELGVQQ